MPPDQIDAITVDQGAPDRLAVRTVGLVPATTGEITVRVAAVSLNRGEVKRALTVADPGTVPGWDFAGVVEETGGVPGAPAVGTRVVVGMLPSGSWAERVRSACVRR